jgi:hypothetical protein
MPFRSHRSRDEPVREGIYYNPSSGWQFRRPSRAHGHGHRRTTSLHDPLPQARQLEFHTARQLDFHTARQLDFHTSYHPGYTESRQQQSLPSSAYTYRQRWQTEEFGVSPFDNAAYTHDMHWQGERHRIHPLDNPRHPGEAQHENHYSYDYQEEYHVPERPQRNPRSRSASLPRTVSPPPTTVTTTVTTIVTMLRSVVILSLNRLVSIRGSTRRHMPITRLRRLKSGLKSGRDCLRYLIW